MRPAHPVLASLNVVYSLTQYTKHFYAVALWGLPVTLLAGWVAWPALDDGFKHSVRAHARPQPLGHARTSSRLPPLCPCTRAQLAPSIFPDPEAKLQ